MEAPKQVKPKRLADYLEVMSKSVFQAGISWAVIDAKWEGFREAFEGFEPDLVAGYGDDDVARLLADPRIVRNRAKVEATVANARAVVALHDQGGSLVEVVFSHAPGVDERPPGRFRAFADMPSVTPASTALAKDLRTRGFRFVGPTVAYSLMEAAGVVDDHLEGCWVDVLAEN